MPLVAQGLEGQKTSADSGRFGYVHLGDVSYVLRQGVMPGTGPITLFDKSTLQSLTIDEAVWFDTFYFPSMTPLFFVETLADLEKEMRNGRSPEEFVGALADKTSLGGGVNIHHSRLSMAELFGHRFDLRHVPIIEGGNHVATRDGRRALVFDPSPESMALSRWRQGEFLEVERQFAKEWRDALSAIDLDSIFKQGRDIIKRIGRPKDLAAAKSAAAQLLTKTSSRYVLDALQALRPEGAAQEIVRRWRYLGCPPIAMFAPYTGHLFLVDLFFCLAMGADLIGRERPTNKVDIAYLYYLPFCMIFTSRDRLHQRTAPLFLDDKQVFLHGDDLKADLARLDAHYSQLPDETKMRGVMSFAHYPPTEADFLVARLWDQLMRPEWRGWATKPPVERSKEMEAKILAELREIADAPRTYVEPPVSDEELGALTIKRSIPVQRGKWRMVPAEVAGSSGD